jgi:hypothetical protein
MTSMVFRDSSTLIDDAEASSALSRSSFTTEQGSDITDVDPMARTVACGRASIGMMA